MNLKHQQVISNFKRMMKKLINFILVSILASAGFTSQEFQIPYSCKYMDIVFVVDGSGSVGEDNYNMIKDWLSNSTTELMRTMEQHVHVGILEYSLPVTRASAKEIVRLGSCLKITCMRQKISRMKFVGGATYTASALHYVVENQFRESKRVNESEKVIFLITDGKASDSANLSAWYKLSVDQRITTFAVGVGRNYEHDELKLIANGNTSSERVYTVENFIALPEIKSKIRRTYCKEPKNALCNDTVSECHCKDHYFWNGTHCADVNECKIESLSCPANSHCINIDGGYECTCNSGFLGKSPNCSECPCISKVFFNDTAADCSVKPFSCFFETSLENSCSVPGSVGFGGIFHAIATFINEASNLTSAMEVIKGIEEIDHTIRCAAVATSLLGAVQSNTTGAEAISLPYIVSENLTIEAIFSKSNVSEVTMATEEKDTTARIIAVQFEAPINSLELLLQERYDNNEDIKQTSYFISHSPVLSFSAFDSKSFTYKDNVEVTFSMDVSKDFTGVNDWEKRLRKNYSDRSFVYDVTYHCVFIDKASHRMSDYGCETVYYETTGSTVTCKCNHTTIFAVLLTVEEMEIPRGVKIASYITEILSVLFLTLTLVILMKIRTSIRGDRPEVQICLTTTLLSLHVLLVFGDIALQNQLACEIITVITHYFLLAAAMWMLMEGVTLVAKTNDYVLQYLTEGNARVLAKTRHVLSWGIPLIIVVTSALIGFMTDTYMALNPVYMEKEYRDILAEQKYNHCWLGSTMRLWAAIVPMAFIFIINLLIIVRMSWVVYKMSSKGDNFKPSNYSRAEISRIQHIHATFKAILVLLPVLGIPWVLAFLAGIDTQHSSRIFMYLNVVINGMQGVLLFLVYCLLGKEVRKAVLLKYKRMEYNRNSLSDLSKRSTRNNPHSLNRTKETDLNKINQGSFEAISSGNDPNEMG